MQAVNKETAQPKSGMHRWEWGITIGIFVIGITTLLTLAGPSIARFFS